MYFQRKRKKQKSKTFFFLVKTPRVSYLCVDFAADGLNFLLPLSSTSSSISCVSCSFDERDLYLPFTSFFPAGPPTAGPAQTTKINHHPISFENSNPPGRLDGRMWFLSPWKRASSGNAVSSCSDPAGVGSSCCTLPFGKLGAAVFKILAVWVGAILCAFGKTFWLLCRTYNNMNLDSL